MNYSRVSKNYTICKFKLSIGCNFFELSSDEDVVLIIFFFWPNVVLIKKCVECKKNYCKFYAIEYHTNIPSTQHKSSKDLTSETHQIIKDGIF